MLPFERKQKILARTLEEGKIEIDRLVKEWNVSGMTIRRDLAALEKEGKIIRTHGGAVSPDGLISETPYQNKVNKNTEEKKAIAETAAGMIDGSATILLDSGTTTLEIARLLKTRKDLVIVTNDVKIALELLDSPSEVICTGGNLQRGIGSLTGSHVEQMLANIQVDFLFLGAHAIDLQAGISAPTLEKASVKKLMVRAARQTWVAADSSKFNRHAFAKVCELDEITGVITDGGLTDAQKEKFEALVQIIYAGKERSE